MIKLKDILIEIIGNEIDTGKYIITKLESLEIENYIKKRLLKIDVNRYNEKVNILNHNFKVAFSNTLESWPTVSLDDAQSWFRKTYSGTQTHRVSPLEYKKKTIIQFQSSDPKTRRPWFYYKAYKDDTGDIRIDFTETTFGFNHSYYFHYNK